MAKVSGKRSAVPKAETSADEPKRKQINLNVLNSSLAERVANKTGKRFISVTIPLMDKELLDKDGNTVFGSIAVDTGRVKPATKPLKDANGQFKKTEDGRIMTEKIPNRSNIWLLSADTKVKVNVNRGDINGVNTYETVIMTAEQVSNAYIAAKEQYKQRMTSQQAQGTAKEVTLSQESDDFSFE